MRWCGGGWLGSGWSWLGGQRTHVHVSDITFPAPSGPVDPASPSPHSPTHSHPSPGARWGFLWFFFSCTFAASHISAQPAADIASLGGPSDALTTTSASEDSAGCTGGAGWVGTSRRSWWDHCHLAVFAGAFGALKRVDPQVEHTRVTRVKRSSGSVVGSGTGTETTATAASNTSHREGGSITSAKIRCVLHGQC